MRVLAACEFSGVVREAFRSLGHDAWSCDPIGTEQPGQHYECSLQNVISRIAEPWDLLIAFPPCTYLASSGARWFKEKAYEQELALNFVRWIDRLPIPKIAIENPIGILSTQLRKPSQIVQPWMFGHGETKATCLWLRGLPALVPTQIVSGRVPRVHHEPPGPDRWKRRSRTYPGLAAAMAQQWGSTSTGSREGGQ